MCYNEREVSQFGETKIKKNMTVLNKKFELKSTKQFEIFDVTKKVEGVIKESGIRRGTISVFTPHTTASIRINHFEPLLLQDILKFMYRVVPMESNYAHDFFEIRTQIESGERSNGNAHVKAFLLGSSETIPVIDGKMALGRRQSIFFVELDGGRKRNYIVTATGE